VTIYGGGFMGPILDVDLTTGHIGNYELPRAERLAFMGGKILGARILWDLLEPGVDPLGPSNVLVFTAGLLNGSNAPSSSRFNCSTKNVLTGGVASSNCGGDFGIWLRKAGYDGLIIRGRAKGPTQLKITEDSVELVDATDLWGKTTLEVQETLAKNERELVIGPAGENLVRFACILSGERALGRCGVGAVMGSKNLKLVTAEGKKKLPVADPDKLKKVNKSWIKELKGHPVTGEQLPSYGTAGLVNITNATHTLTTHNFKKGHWEHADDVSGETLAETLLVKNDGCRSCPIRCARVVEREGKNIKGPEFETLGMFGPSMGNRDLKKIIEWNYLSDELGMDTISLGSTLACAMELKEQGKLPDLDISFDDHDKVAKLIEDIAHRRGLGDAIAEGSKRLAESCGAPELAMQTKGMEFAAYEPRGAVGHGLGYAVSNRGGCHINGGYLVYFEALGQVNMEPLTPKGKPAWAMFQQNAFEAVSAAGNCIFVTYAFVPPMPPALYNPTGASAKLTSKALIGSRLVFDLQSKLRPGVLPLHLPGLPQSKAIEAIIGRKFRAGDFIVTGERGFTLERLINLREGLMADQDTLPPRLTDEPERPALPNSKVPLQEMLPVYYKVRGWDHNGVPRASLLRKLGLDFAISTADEIRQDPARFRARKRRLDKEETDARQQTAGVIGPNAG